MGTSARWYQKQSTIGFGLWWRDLRGRSKEVGICSALDAVRNQRQLFASVKKQKSLILTKVEGVLYFMGGPVTLFLSVFRQNYRGDLFHLILSE